MDQKNLLKKIPIGLLMLIILINITQVMPDVLQFGKGILEDSAQPGLWRGARFARSRNFADYVIFLNEQIPEDAEVVLPPEEAAMWTLANTPAMEFFLAPREIRNCTELSCGETFLNRDQTYVLIMGLDRFPGEQIKGQPEHIRMLNDTWGVYGPEEGLGQGTSPGFHSFFLNLARGIAWPLLTYLLWFAVGSLLIGWLVPELGPWISLGLGFGLILGLESLFLYLALLLGLENISGVMLVFWLLIFFILFCGWRRGDIQPGKWIRALTSSEEGWLYRLALVGFGGFLTYLAVGSGHHATDAYVLWGAKGAGILSEGLSGAVAGTNTTRYPLHIPLLIAGQKSLFGDVLPASKLMFPGYYLSTLFLVYGYLRQRSGEAWAGLASLALATMPVVMRHGRVGYANLPLAFYLVSGSLMIPVFQEGLGSSRGKRVHLLGGLLLAFAAWTRPEGAWQVFGLLIAAAVWYSGPFPNRSGKIPWRLALMPVLLWTLWSLTSRGFYGQVTGSEGFLQNLIEEVIQGRMHLNDLGYILFFTLKQMVNPQTWGTAGVGAVLLWTSVLVVRKKNLGSAPFLAWAGAVFVFFMIGVYFTFAFEPVHELEWWLTSGFNRMILPGMLLVWVSGAEAWGRSLAGVTPSLQRPERGEDEQGDHQGQQD